MEQNISLDSKEGPQTVNGLLVCYRDDQLDESVNLAIKRKSRVRYRCMDTFSNFLAFGTTSGAIYLFRLKSITHSSCMLVSMIPCDQGSIGAIRFLPIPQNDDLLIAIGTSRGSLVIFRLSQLAGEQSPLSDEIYRAESFTNNSGIKLIEYDQDLLDPLSSFTKLYICDLANRLYVLESSSIFPVKQTLRLFYTNNSPALIFSVNNSSINQISVHRSQLLISTNETTHLFNEHSNQPHHIGKKKRREGFYGACFFNPNYKPVTHQNQMMTGSQQTVYSSTNSLNELENLLLFVARPSLRLWQVNSKREVMFTHQFESLIKSTPPVPIIDLHNEPLDLNGFEETLTSTTMATNNVIAHSRIKQLDDPTSVMNAFGFVNNEEISSKIILHCDHFQRLIQIHTSTLGNLLLSYNQHEIFIIDPIGAKLIVWHTQKAPIIQICCNENEFYVMSLVTSKNQEQQQQQQFTINRLVLLAPTQFVLELHRIHRYLTLASFVQLFKDQFRSIMALPLSGPRNITTEGGLLRNVLYSAWDFLQKNDVEENSGDLDTNGYQSGADFVEFKKMIDDILDESNQLKESLNNLTDSRFFLAMASENIERLSSEPYTSLVSLEISIADLHTNHVIHFSKEALNRHKSVANLSRSIRNLGRPKAEVRQITRSTFDVRRDSTTLSSEENSNYDSSTNDLTDQKEQRTSGQDNKVIVERQRPINLSNRRNNQNGNEDLLTIDRDEAQSASIRPSQGPFFSPRSREEAIKRREEYLSPSKEGEEDEDDDMARSDLEKTKDLPGKIDSNSSSINSIITKPLEFDPIRCSNCQWPRPRSHLRPMHSSQRIQYSWIEENLLANFEENIEQIEERAFKHGLWNLLLKCLAFRNKFDDYITCCIMLDDVRLLNLEQFVITRRPDDNLMDCILQLMSSKLDFVKEIQLKHQVDGGPHHNIGLEDYCFKCHNELERNPDELHDDYAVDVIASTDNDHSPRRSSDRISFNLVNLFEQFMMRPNADIKRSIGLLLKYPKLIEESRIPARFYLRAIEKAVEEVRVANQALIGRGRLARIRSDSRQQSAQ